MEIFRFKRIPLLLPTLGYRILGYNDEERAVEHTGLDVARITSRAAHTFIWHAADVLGVSGAQSRRDRKASIPRRAPPRQELCAENHDQRLERVGENKIILHSPLAKGNAGSLDCSTE